MYFIINYILYMLLSGQSGLHPDRPIYYHLLFSAYYYDCVLLIHIFIVGITLSGDLLLYYTLILLIATKATSTGYYIFVCLL